MNRAPALPPVTDAHRRAAFEAMRWPGWTFEAAMAADMRRRLIEARAHQMRTQQWLATQHHSRVAVRRCRIDGNTFATQWLTLRATGPLVPIETDLLTHSTETP